MGRLDHNQVAIVCYRFTKNGRQPINLLGYVGNLKYTNQFVQYVFLPASFKPLGLQYFTERELQFPYLKKALDKIKFATTWCFNRIRLSGMNQLLDALKAKFFVF